MESKPTFDQLYLDRLTFDQQLKKMWLSFFVYRFRVIALMIALISVWGVYSFFQTAARIKPRSKNSDRGGQHGFPRRIASRRRRTGNQKNRKQNLRHHGNRHDHIVFGEFGFQRGRPV